MRKKLLALLPALLVGLAGCGNNEGGGSVTAPGAVPAADASKAVTLRLKPNVGDKYTTTVVVDLDVQPPAGQGEPMKAVMEMASLDEVTEVKDGKITIKSKIEKADVTGEGVMAAAMKQSISQFQGKETTSVYDERGKVLEEDALSKQAGAGTSPRPTYPEGPIKKGDTWSDKVESNGQQADATFLAEGIEMIDGKEAMKITMTVKSAQLPQGFPLTYWVDVSNGRLLKGNGEMTTEQGGGKMVMKITLGTK